MLHTDIKHVLPNLSGAVLLLRDGGQTNGINNEEEFNVQGSVHRKYEGSPKRYRTFF